MAWPIPLVPPVTKAVCPSRENNCSTEVMIAGVVGVAVISYAAAHEDQDSSTVADNRLGLYGGG